MVGGRPRAARFHPGWLRAHRHDGSSGDSNRAERTVWDASTPGLPPTFDGASVLADDDVLLEWLRAFRAVGVTRLRNVPLDPDAVGRVAAASGSCARRTSVSSSTCAPSRSRSRTPTPRCRFPPHVDLATREYQPGLQFLHCLENSTTGGDGRYLDGFRLAAVVRDEHPADFETLTTVPWRWANRSPDSDYRWASTPIVLDRDGEVVEIRVGNWLRAPLHASFEDVEAAYAAYRTLFSLTYRDDLAIRVSYAPGDLMAFDNRRILHGRDAFEAAGGAALPARLLRRARGAGLADPHPRAQEPGAGRRCLNDRAVPPRTGGR